MNRKEKVEEIVNTYGKRQIPIAIEEMAELTQALTKYLRFMNGDKAMQKDIAEVLENIKEEIADVFLTVTQMQVLFGVSEEETDKIIERKIKRTLETDCGSDELKGSFSAYPPDTLCVPPSFRQGGLTADESCSEIQRRMITDDYLYLTD